MSRWISRFGPVDVYGDLTERERKASRPKTPLLFRRRRRIIPFIPIRCPGIIWDADTLTFDDTRLCWPFAPAPLCLRLQYDADTLTWDADTLCWEFAPAPPLYSLLWDADELMFEGDRLQWG